MARTSGINFVFDKDVKQDTKTTIFIRNNHIEDVFIRKYHGEDEKGRVLSTFEPTGFIPKVTEEIRGHGHDIPHIIYHAAQQRGGGEARGSAGRTDGH